jgi:hypothetical protein
MLLIQPAMQVSIMCSAQEELTLTNDAGALDAQLPDGAINTRDQSVANYLKLFWVIFVKPPTLQAITRNGLNRHPVLSPRFLRAHFEGLGLQYPRPQLACLVLLLLLSPHLFAEQGQGAPLELLVSGWRAIGRRRDTIHGLVPALRRARLRQLLRLRRVRAEDEVALGGHLLGQRLADELQRDVRDRCLRIDMEMYMSRTAICTARVRL